MRPCDDEDAVDSRQQRPKSLIASVAARGMYPATRGVIMAFHGKDRRSSKRSHVRMTACLTIGNIDVGGVLHDVSSTGVLLEVSMRVGEGVFGLLSASGISGKPPVRVVREIPVGDGRMGLGLEFVRD
jgi:hypothetical protein